MRTNGESLTAALDSGDLDHLIGLLDELVIWRGVILTDHDHEEVDEHDHGPPLCTDRDQVRALFERYFACGGTANPVVIAEVGDTVVIDSRPEPPRPFQLHQSFTFRRDRVVLTQDYPDRVSALADVGR